MSPSDDTRSPSGDTEVWTRDQAIAKLREELLKLSDGESSICTVAAKLGVFCHGFRRWTDEAFSRGWTRALGRSTHLTRPQMERLADLWLLTEQLRLRVPCACDLAAAGGGVCRGWNGFSNADLERCCDEILGRNVAIVETNQTAQNRPGPRKRLTPRRSVGIE
jgi:hypothetical protein